MARKKKSSTEKVPDETKHEPEVDEEEEEVVYLQVDTGDIIKLKQILDEAVAGALLEETTIEGIQNAMNERCIGLLEDHKWNNIKLILMTLACAFAVVAQFAPLPFPESRPVIGACCAAYFALSGILQLITTFVDRDCILITKIVEKEKIQRGCLEKNPDLLKYGLRVRSSFPRFSEFYTVQIEYQGYEESPFVSKTWSVGQFFDKEGMFDEFGLEYEVEQLYRRFESGKFDKNSNSVSKVKKS